MITNTMTRGLGGPPSTAAPIRGLQSAQDNQMAANNAQRLQGNANAGLLGRLNQVQLQNQIREAENAWKVPAQAPANVSPHVTPWDDHGTRQMAANNLDYERRSAFNEARTNRDREYNEGFINRMIGRLGSSSSSSSSGGGSGGGGGAAPPVVQPTAALEDGARNAALAQAKDTAGQIGRGAMNALGDVMGARGMIGSGMHVNEAGGVINSGAEAVSGVNRDFMQDSLDNTRQRNSESYQGNITQRGQNITMRGQNLADQANRRAQSQSALQGLMGSISFGNKY